MIGLLQVKKLVKQLDGEAEAKAIDSWVLGRNNGWPLAVYLLSLEWEVVSKNIHGVRKELA